MLSSFTGSFWAGRRSSGASTFLVTDNLVLHLDASDPGSYPGTGTTWFDLSGIGNDATLMNGAAYSADNSGVIVLGNDLVNDYIAVPNDNTLSPSSSQSITLQIWVKFSEFQAGAYIFRKSVLLEYNYDGYYLFADTNGSYRALTNGTSIQKTHNAAGTLNTDTWYFLTFITNITNIAGSTKIYNGITETYSGFHGTDGYSEAGELLLASGLTGQVGAMYTYQKALSTVEIEQNYHATKTRFGL